MITMVDNNTMKVGLVGHEVNGEPVPRVPAITVVWTASADPAAGEGK